MTTVAVLDYGMGNLRSVCKAIEHAAPAARVRLTAEAGEIARAERVVFPGQGAIHGCVEALERCGLRAALGEALASKPFLGICLGLQALYEWSEEGGGTPGLGLFAGRVRLFAPQRMQAAAGGAALKVPHMGWNQVEQIRAHPLWEGIAQQSRFYFVHSYYADSHDRACVAGVTDYGIRFTSAAARGNIFAVQFHPEKSQKAGLKLLENFVKWDGTGP